jgi:hypothetical protein
MGTDHLAEARDWLSLVTGDESPNVPTPDELAVSIATAHALVSIAESLALQARLADFAANGPGGPRA